MVLFWGAVYFVYFDSVPLKISPETTVITKPLTPDGKMVDFRERFRDVQDTWLGVSAPEENGFRLFLKAFGPTANRSNVGAS